MKDMGETAAGFCCLGGEGRVAGQRPIDMAHLSRQTMGDRAVEREVLSLFVQQLLSVREELRTAGDAEARRIAHGVKGAARSVGAHAVAECAVRIETAPGDPSEVARLAALVDEVRLFVATIDR